MKLTTAVLAAGLSAVAILPARAQVATTAPATPTTEAEVVAQETTVRNTYDNVKDVTTTGFDGVEWFNVDSVSVDADAKFLSDGKLPIRPDKITWRFTVVHVTRNTDGPSPLWNNVDTAYFLFGQEKDKRYKAPVFSAEHKVTDSFGFYSYFDTLTIQVPTQEFEDINSGPYTCQIDNQNFDVSGPKLKPFQDLVATIPAN